jgi:hypothetical protein
MRRALPGRLLGQTALLALVFTLTTCSEDRGPTQPRVQALYTTPTGLVTANPPEIFTGAGDIASCSSTGDEATALLLDNVPGTIYNLGDNTYPNGTDQEFNDCYDPTWGRQKARTHPSPGNHEYNTNGATGYYNYFGAAAGDPTKGYYSYNLGAWHIIVLNSNISRSPGSAQDTWLQNDLATNQSVCTLAYWHHALYGSDEGSGTGGSVYSSVRPYWDRLYPAGADVVLNGHRHFYERLAPMKADGTADPQYGVREFIVGSGGIGGATLGTNVYPTSEALDGVTRGVLKLYLYDDSYAWRFIPIAGETFTDSGSTACHGAPGSTGGVSASLSTVSASPTTLTASNGSSTSTITITAKDANGNPISGATVVLSASGSGNTLTQPSGTTNSSGVATGTLSSTLAEAKTVSATISGVGITQTAAITVNPGAAAALAFTTQPTSAAAGATLSPAPVVELRDQFGNHVNGTNAVTLAIGTNPGGGTLSGTTTVNAVNGVATFSTVSLDRAGTGYTLTAAASGLSSATSNAFDITAGGVSAGLSTVSASPTTLTASTGASTSTITVTAKDANGNPISGATVVLSASGSGNTLTQPSGATNASGVATGSLSSTLAEPKTVSATISGAGITQTAAITVNPAAAAVLAFTTQPSNSTTGATLSPAPAVELRDQFGNHVNGTNAVTLAIGTNPGGGTLSGTTTVNAVNGVATFSTVSLDQAGTGYTLVASASGLSSATSNTFDITGSASPLMVTNVETLFKTTNNTSYSMSSHTLTAGRLYLLAVESRVSGAPPDVPTVSGTGVTWTQEGTTLYYGVATNDSRLTLFSAVPTSDETSTITVQLGSTTNTHCSMTLVEVQGQDVNYRGQAPGMATLDGGTATSLAVSLASAPASGNAMVATYIHYGVSEDVVPDGNFTELGEARGPGTKGDATTVEASYRAAGQQTATATWATPSYGAAILFEVRRHP